MIPPRFIGFVVGLAVIAAASLLGVLHRRNETAALRGELEIARTEAAELVRLQGENRRLRERQIPAADLEALRADRAALPRLRSELEALRKTAPPAPR